MARYETVKLKFKDNSNENHVVDTELDFVIGIFPTAKAARMFREIRQSQDAINSW